MSEQLSFLPTPEFLPLLPPHGSAAAQALDDLCEGSITQLDWLRDGKGWRLAAAVKQLDYLGWGHHHCNVVVKDSGITKTLEWMQEVLARNIAEGHLPAPANSNKEI